MQTWWILIGLLAVSSDAEQVANVPDWLADYPRAVDRANTASGTSVERSYTALGASPSAVVIHYREALAKAAINFSTEFSRGVTVIHAAREKTFCEVLITSRNNGTRVTATCEAEPPVSATRDGPLHFDNRPTLPVQPLSLDTKAVDSRSTSADAPLNVVTSSVDGIEPTVSATGASPGTAGSATTADVPTTVHVREYTRKDGTVVRAHDRSAPGTRRGK